MPSVINNLEEAFRRVRPPSSRRKESTIKLSSKQLPHLAGEIYSLNVKALHYCLPRILQWLCRREASNSIDKEVALTVLRLLSEHTPKKDYEWIAKTVGKRAAKYTRRIDTDLRRLAQERFGHYSKRQAAAIVNWLDCVRSWDVYDGEIDTIAIARAYWANLAEK